MENFKQWHEKFRLGQAILEDFAQPQTSEPIQQGSQQGTQPVNQQNGPDELQQSVGNLWRVLHSRYGNADVGISRQLTDEIAHLKSKHGNEPDGGFSVALWTFLKTWFEMKSQRISQQGIQNSIGNNYGNTNNASNLDGAGQPQVQH